MNVFRTNPSTVTASQQTLKSEKREFLYSSDTFARLGKTKKILSYIIYVIFPPLYTYAVFIYYMTRLSEHSLEISRGNIII